MNWQTPDQIDRTAKILVDSGQATDFDDAGHILANLVLQIAVGADIADRPAAQAALATAVNVGRRAFHGGVRVCLDADAALTIGWTAGMTAEQTVTQYGGTVVSELDDAFPTLVVGRPQRRASGSPVLYLGWRGWSGGVFQSPAYEWRDDPATPIAGVLAAALGVSETFQRVLGATTPGRRDVGISLWRPDLDWRLPTAVGPRLDYLPAALWILGLGHLGQAYAWTLGMLPYADPGTVRFGLLDFDTVVSGNWSTQLFVNSDHIGKRKTRVVSAALEKHCFTTQLVERPFDQHFHPVSHANPLRNEPTVALSGFDSPTPRRSLSRAGFTRITDAGIGTGPVEYLDMVLNTFPAAVTSEDAFPDPPDRAEYRRSAYESEVARRIAAGQQETAARCGILDIAGITVGAAFVGAVASTLAVADILRLLNDGQNYSVISLDLRTPRGVQAVPNTAPGDFAPPAWTMAQ